MRNPYIIFLFLIYTLTLTFKIKNSYAVMPCQIFCQPSQIMFALSDMSPIHNQTYHWGQGEEKGVWKREMRIKKDRDFLKCALGHILFPELLFPRICQPVSGNQLLSQFYTWVSKASEFSGTKGMSNTMPCPTGLPLKGLKGPRLSQNI